MSLHKVNKTYNGEHAEQLYQVTSGSLREQGIAC